MKTVSCTGQPCQRVPSPVVRHVSAAPQVPGSNPRWGGFRKTLVKKSPRWPRVQNTGNEIGPGRPEDRVWPRQVISRVTSPSVWVGPGFGGFLGLCEKVLSSKPGGRLAPRRSSFFLQVSPNNTERS